MDYRRNSEIKEGCKRFALTCKMLELLFGKWWRASLTIPFMVFGIILLDIVFIAVVLFVVAIIVLLDICLQILGG